MRRKAYDYKPCPEEEYDAAVGELLPDTKKSFNKIVNAMKQIGWTIRPFYDPEIDWSDAHEEGAANITFFFDLSLKGGQKIIVDRKKIVADDVIFLEDFFVTYHTRTYEHVVEESTDSYYKTDCPSPEIEHIKIGVNNFDKWTDAFEKVKWKEGQEQKMAQVLTKAIFEDYFRSKWKKRGSLIQRVASRYLKAQG